MCQLFQIQFLLNRPEFWRIQFISIGLFGIYLSIIIIGSGRIKKQQGILLGLYIAALSTLLLSLSSRIHTLPGLDGTLFTAGLVSLFLAGPFSYHLFFTKGIARRPLSFFIQFIPALLAIVLSRIDLFAAFWIYLAGFIHAGSYMAAQALRINFSSWRKRYCLAQMASYMVIVIVRIIWPTELNAIISSICLVILILWIWIRLLYTAYLAYLVKYQ